MDRVECWGGGKGTEREGKCGMLGSMVYFSTKEGVYLVDVTRYVRLSSADIHPVKF